MDIRAALSAKIAGILTTLNSNYVTLRDHPFARGERADSSARGEFADLLNRTLPITNEERIIYEFIRQLAWNNRSGFAEGIFKMHHVCLSLCVDGAMVGSTLKTNDYFNIDQDRTGHYYINAPHGNHKQYEIDQRKSGRHRGGRNRRGGRDNRQRQPPTLDAQTFNDLFNQVEQQATEKKSYSEVVQTEETGVIKILNWADEMATMDAAAN
jgi:hypothetical protein